MPVAVLMPQMGESIAEGTLVRWIKKVGEAVDRDEPLFEISTDKVDAEIPSPASGVLLAINVQEGETAAVNSVVAVIGEAGSSKEAIEAASQRQRSASTPSTRTAAVAAVEQQAAAVAAARVDASPMERADGDREPRSSPLVRRLAQEHGIDISQVHGTGLGGRVTKEDILRHVEDRSQATSQPQGGTVAAGDRVEPMSAMRKRIAEHMILSRRTSAHVHSVFHVDFSAVERLRAAKKGEYERAGANLTFLVFIAKAVIDAIGRHPVVNTSIDGDKVVYKKDINLGIAVALDSGLIVPVIRQAGERKTLDLAKAIADIASRARARKLSPEEVQGGTFTITNPGHAGAQFGLPIINQPQVAILGVGTIEKRAVVVDDAVAIRPMAYLTLGFDHRLIDGAVADAFMGDVKHLIEHFDSKDL